MSWMVMDHTHLCSAIIGKLKGSAVEYTVLRCDLKGDGIILLNALRATYENLLTVSQLVAAERKFTGYFRGPDQLIESYVTELKT